MIWAKAKQLQLVISSVAAGFGRHGMPPPASNDTGTAFCFLNKEAEIRRTDVSFVRVPSINFGDSTTIRFRFMGHWANTAQTDHVTLWPWSLTLEVMAPVADAGRRTPSIYQSLKFLVLAIRKIWRTMCVSINGPDDPDLWPLDLETGMRIESNVRKLPSKFGHARPLGSRIRYVRDGRTDRQTDGRTEATLIALFLRWHYNTGWYAHHLVKNTIP